MPYPLTALEEVLLIFWNVQVSRADLLKMKDVLQLYGSIRSQLLMTMLSFPVQSPTNQVAIAQSIKHVSNIPLKESHLLHWDRSKQMKLQ